MELYNHLCHIRVIWSGSSEPLGVEEVALTALILGHVGFILPIKVDCQCGLALCVSVLLIQNQIFMVKPSHPTVGKDCVVCDSVNSYLMVNSIPGVADRDRFLITVNILE